MKKYILFICIVVLIFTTACSNKLKTYSEINYIEYLEKIENGETFPLVIGSASCSACAMFKGTMESFIKKYQVEVFYIDISKLSEEEYNSLKTDTSFDSTPTTVFFESGKLTSFYNRMDGAESLSKVKDYFKNNNYID